MNARNFGPLSENRSLRRPANRRRLVNYLDIRSSLGNSTGNSERIIPIERTLSFPGTNRSSERNDAAANIRIPIIRTSDFSTSRNDTGPSYSDKISPADSVEEPEKESLPEVVSLDLHLHENTHAHHTDKFEQVETGQLIVRRGQPFDVTITYDRKVDKPDNLQLLFEYGANPLPGKGTQVALTSGTHADQWRMQVARVHNSGVKVTVTPGPECCVGDWKVTVTWKGARARQREGTPASCPMIILFNPWCREDTVYFRDQTLLSEYILNDSGCIFTGTNTQIGAQPWFFGQFEPGILEAAIFCLRKSFNFRSGRFLGDPVKVSRALSRVVNSNDDNGVLTGGWSGEYLSGSSPLSWVGSVKILRQYLDTKLPVRYGQCFVFAGIITSICRALGLPCRCVTNFTSAHDTDGSVTVDVYLDVSDDPQGLTVNNRATDTIWNFHVWNDVWMRRPDLPAGYDGWQVVDATPQELSKGVFQCGPAPLAAVLRGECTMLYDVPFIYAEVNADRVYWGRSGNTSDWSVIDVDKSAIGQLLSTKVPDGRPIPPSLTDCEQFREDVTSQYKFPESTNRERMSVLLASMTSQHGRHDIYNTDNEIDIKLKNDDHLLIGSDFHTTLFVTNRGQQNRSVTGKVICDITAYTGIKLGTCHQEVFSVDVPAWQTVQYTFTVASNDYLRFRLDGAIFKHYVIARVVETGQMKATAADFRLRMPDLKLKVMSGSPRAGSPVQVSVMLRNPLPNKTLTNCVLVVECSSSESEKGINIRNIRDNDDMEVIVTLHPRKRGLRQIFASFSCDQLRGIKGVTDVLVY